MRTLDYALADADNHYYETADAFTRHLPETYARLFEWAEIRGRRRLVVNGRVNSFIPNPTFDPIGKPGALSEYFLGQPGAGASFMTRLRDVEPLADHPEYVQRDARLAAMDTMNVERAWLLPTLAVGMQVALTDDPAACAAAFGSFNRWLDDDWGYDHEGRINALPYLALVDVDTAVAELERVLTAGAVVVCIVPGPVTVRGVSWSPFGPEYDRFWGLANEAGITVAVHGGASVYRELEQQWSGRSTTQAFFGSPIGAYLANTHRDIADTLAAMVLDRLFERHRRLRVAVLENGCEWLGQLMNKLDVVHHQRESLLSERPSDTIRRHVWVAPFWEDDPQECVRLMGADHTLLGSDWPHLEGIGDPNLYVERLSGLDDADVRAVMRENTIALSTPLRGEL